MAAKPTGYNAAITAIVWTTPTQDFDSLTDGEYCSLSDEIDNSTNLYAMVDLEFDLGSAAFTGGTIGIYLVPSIDGTNFGKWEDNVATAQVENEQYYVGSVTVSDETEAQNVVACDFVLPNGKYKWGFRNNTGIALNATNTVSWRPHAVEDA